VTRRRLGEDGLVELAECLWPVDCQSCGRLLGDDPPAVVVDDLSVVAMASLHHQRCRLPVWNDSMLVDVGSERYTTFVVRMVLLPAASAAGMSETYPLMLVNPGLECVQLEQVQGSGWRVGHSPWLARAGLVRPGRQLVFGAPVDGLVARVTDSSVVVVLQVPPFTVYEAPADERLLDRARGLGGVLFAVTPTLNPGDCGIADLSAALSDRRTLAGWAGLHGSYRPPPSRRFRLRSQACVLHWNSDQMSVGIVVRRAPRRLTTDQARAWAERVISAGLDGPVNWRPAREGHPEEGCQALGLFTGRQHVLRHRPDGWELVLICAQSDGGRAETDNEAKAWAAEMLRLHLGISHLTWRPGPSVPGSVTLYGNP
jgi:hypothetical protein